MADDEGLIYGGLSDSQKRYCTKRSIIFIGLIGAAVLAGVICVCLFVPPPRIEYVGPTTPPSEPPITAVTPTEGAWRGHLPDYIIPKNYAIYLKPYLYDDDLGPNNQRFTFDGRVIIAMHCNVATTVITLHLDNINMMSYSLTERDGRPLNIVNVSYALEYQFVNFHLETLLESDKKYFLYIDYVGQLLDDLRGFYRSTYVTPEGTTKWIATSQMEPTDARRVFPCFDEPSFKAEFNVTIEHRDYMVALSNGIEESTTNVSGGWVNTTFRSTPKMSTYLLAFVVGEFNHTETTMASGAKFRVWARREVMNKTAYAQSIGGNISDYYGQYFNTPFPLEKQDNLAVPDFAAGAMENWGLIIYRETYLHYDPLVNSASNKQLTAAVMAHELAHQWFGNLVTLEWWDDLWLNEGFASYVEYIGTDHVEPDWEMKQQFVIRELQYVFEADGLGSSHPIRVTVQSPDEISQIFDAISYSKGATMIRMLNHFLSEDVFLAGISEYLHTHAESNANTDDVWDALTKADEGKGNNDVKTIMDTWTLQMGYPVVDFRRTQRTMVNVSQQHFLIDPNSKVDPKYKDLGYLWWVYVTITHQTDLKFTDPTSEWLEKKPWKLIQLTDTIKDEDWFLANTFQYGYYRVNYDITNWEKLATQLQSNHTVIPIENRAQLINDALNVARAGRLAYHVALALTNYLDTETDYVPWQAASSTMLYIANMFSKYSGYGYLETYMRNQIDNMYTTLGWNDTSEDPHLTQLNRIQAIDVACKYRNEECLTQASQLLATYMQDSSSNPITPNLKSTVYCFGIQEGGQKEWDFGWDMYHQTGDAAEQGKWQYALSCSQVPWILVRYLEYSLNSSLIRKQDATSVIVDVSYNYVGQSLAWEFLQTKWDTLVDYFGIASMSLERIVSGITKNFNTEIELQQLQAFGEGKILGAADRAYQQALERTQANIAWMDAYKKTIADWLQNAA